jgi:hypothetical protein
MDSPSGGHGRSATTLVRPVHCEFMLACGLIRRESSLFFDGVCRTVRLGVTDRPSDRYGLFVFRVNLLVVLFVNIDCLSKGSDRLSVPDGPSATSGRTVSPRQAVLPKCFACRVVLTLCNFFGLVPKVGRSVVTT